MGCAIPTGRKTTVTMFSSQTETDRKVKLERKLYLAKETPEPIFDLSGCYLKQIPSGVFSICKVFRKESLLLNDNEIESLQDGGQLSDLYLIKILDLSNNFLTKLDDVSPLVNLHELNLKGNKLKFLPESIGYLGNLRILDVSANCLTRTPSSLGNLKKLRSLDISRNIDLKYLSPDLCGAYNLININLDADNFAILPNEIAHGGTETIMRYLCDLAGVEYRKPDVNLDISSRKVNTVTFDVFYKTNPASWEKEERRMQELENQMQAAKIQRRQFLQELSAEKIKLDAEVDRICNEREVDRLKLLRDIQKDEDIVQETVGNLMDLNNKSPQRLQQMIQLEQMEHDRLLELSRENYNNIRKVDTLKAMESFVKEECRRDISLQRYGDIQGKVKQSFLSEELQSCSKLTDLFKHNDDVHSQFVQQLLEEENVQKAAVASLLEKVDARTWSLLQEISMVQDNLAKLSAIEMNKTKLNMSFNVETLTDQRLQLSYLLVDLLDQQEKRRGQLIDTLKEMEVERDDSTDFWLRSYQRLLEFAPLPFLQTERHLDPILANHLLQMGVIHCLPFLVKWIFSKEKLSSLTDFDLKRNGVMLSEDRKSILKAIMYYLEGTHEKCKLEATTSTYFSPSHVETPSAPPIDLVNAAEQHSEEITSINNTECVICMDRSCEIVFVPCGHLCCCVQCTDTVTELCPLCRQNIERKIRVIKP